MLLPNGAKVQHRMAVHTLRSALGPRLRGDDVGGDGRALNWRHSRGGGNPRHRAALTLLEQVGFARSTADSLALARWV